MELYLETPKLTRSPATGRLLPGFVPHNKGKTWKDYNVPAKSKKKILANLSDAGRIKGNKCSKKRLCKAIVGIKDGEFFGYFESANDAERKLNKKGIIVSNENIRTCCYGKRPTAGGVKWFYESDFEKWNKEIITPTN